MRVRRTSVFYVRRQFRLGYQHNTQSRFYLDAGLNVCFGTFAELLVNNSTISTDVGTGKHDHNTTLECTFFILELLLERKVNTQQQERGFPTDKSGCSSSELRYLERQAQSFHAAFFIEL